MLWQVMSHTFGIIEKIMCREMIQLDYAFSMSHGIKFGPFPLEVSHRMFPTAVKKAVQKVRPIASVHGRHQANLMVFKPLVGFIIHCHRSVGDLPRNVLEDS